AIFRAFNAAVAGTLPAPTARATPWPIPAPALRAAVLAVLLLGGTLLYGWLVSANRFPSPGGGNPAANRGNAPTLVGPELPSQAAARDGLAADGAVKGSAAVADALPAAPAGDRPAPAAGQPQAPPAGATGPTSPSAPSGPR